MEPVSGYSIAATRANTTVMMVFLFMIPLVMIMSGKSCSTSVDLSAHFLIMMATVEGLRHRAMIELVAV